MNNSYWQRSMEIGDVPGYLIRGNYGDHDEAVMVAAERVSRLANWYEEQDSMLNRLIIDRESKKIREWAREMRNDMPDDDAWPQDFCDRVAAEMDSLADLIDSVPAIED